MTYDVPNATDIWNQTGFINFMSNINTASGNILGVGLMLSIFTIGLVLFSGFTRNARILNSLALTLFSAIFLSFAELIPVSYVVTIAAFTTLFFLFDFFTQE